MYKKATPSLQQLYLKQQEKLEKKKTQINNIYPDLSNKAKCPCGSYVVHRHINQHFKSKKHQDWFESP
jgi:hypothetical protein